MAGGVAGVGAGTRKEGEEGEEEEEREREKGGAVGMPENLVFLTRKEAEALLRHTLQASNGDNGDREAGGFDDKRDRGDKGCDK